MLWLLLMYFRPFSLFYFIGGLLMIPVSSAAKTFYSVLARLCPGIRNRKCPGSCCSFKVEWDSCGHSYKKQIFPLGIWTSTSAEAGVVLWTGIQTLKWVPASGAIPYYVSFHLFLFLMCNCGKSHIIHSLYENILFNHI